MIVLICCPITVSPRRGKGNSFQRYLQLLRPWTTHDPVSLMHRTDLNYHSVKDLLSLVFITSIQPSLWKRKQCLALKKMTPLNLSSAGLNTSFFSTILLLCIPWWLLHLVANLILLHNFVNFDPFGNTQVQKTAIWQTLGTVFLVLKNDYAKKLFLAELPKKSSPCPMTSAILSQPIFFVNLIIASKYPCKLLRSKTEENQGRE